MLTQPVVFVRFYTLVVTRCATKRKSTLRCYDSPLKWTLNLTLKATAMTSATPIQKNQSNHISKNYDDSEKFNEFSEHYVITEDQLKVIFIGNSITLHGPAPEIGWISNHGMAATHKEDDYCHILLQRLNVKSENVFIGNFADIERINIIDTEIFRQVNTLLKKKPSLTVIQLGDNIGNNEQLDFFIKNVSQVALIAKQNCHNILMLSTWWESQAKDQVIKQICDLLNLKFIYIGDLFNSEFNTDRKVKQFEHAGVDNHPRNWAMEQIANRIFTSVNL